MSRLRELAEQATAWDDAAPQSEQQSVIEAQRALRAAAPDLAVLLADAKDALAKIQEQASLAIQGDKRLPYLTHIGVLSAWALARIEELEGKA